MYAQADHALNGRNLLQEDRSSESPQGRIWRHSRRIFTLRALALREYLLARAARGRTLRFAWPPRIALQPHHRSNYDDGPADGGSRLAIKAAAAATKLSASRTASAASSCGTGNTA